MGRVSEQVHVHIMSEQDAKVIMHTGTCTVPGADVVGEEGVLRGALVEVVEGAALNLVVHGLREELLQPLWGQHHRGWEET